MSKQVKVSINVDIKTRAVRAGSRVIYAGEARAFGQQIAVCPEACQMESEKDVIHYLKETIKEAA